MISAKIIAHSIANDIPLITAEWCYPRFIHSEVMTHRMFSRNASSSRAIPVEKVLEQVRNYPAMPIHWGKNQPGMQAREECNNYIEYTYLRKSREKFWEYLANVASYQAEAMSKAGYHKQIVNRLLEPFQWMKVIVTATEWDNFFKLRDHDDAQPEIRELARCMKKAMDESTPVKLEHGEWHLPYVHFDVISRGYFDDNDTGQYWYELEEAKKCSVARCARVSYNNHDNSSPNIEKDIALADRLLAARHMSPFEHIATPMDWIYYADEVFLPNLEKGITHVDRNGNLWSGNFRGFLQYRQLL